MSGRIWVCTGWSELLPSYLKHLTFSLGEQGSMHFVKVDSSKVIAPIFNLFTREGQGNVMNDNALSGVESRLNEVGSTIHGSSSAFLTLMKASDTSLDKAIEQDFRYRVLQTRLNNYKSYPIEAIRKDTEAVVYGSMFINSLIVFQAYASPDSLSLESLSQYTQLSDIKKGQVNLVNVNVIEIMDNTIDESNTRLKERVEEYLRAKGRMK